MTLYDNLELHKVIEENVKKFIDMLVGSETSLEDTVNFPEKSYILGRLSAILSSDEFKELNYEKVKEELVGAEYSHIEQMVLENIRQNLSDHIRTFTNNLISNVLAKLRGAGNTAIYDIILENKDSLKDHYQKVISTLAKDLKKSWETHWRVILETELCKIKQLGIAHTIINKVGPYENSDGIDSWVSIIPSADACEDCLHHYMDASGNPKVFKLRELVEEGSNADGDVDHSRKHGLHVNWKTTLPALHPTCQCKLTYIPRGMGWLDKSLKIIDQEEFKKATDTGSLSATIKPPGPKATQAIAGIPKTPSIKGAAAPSNLPGPGRPKTGSTQPPSGNKLQMVDCPFGGGDECRSNGGNGAKSHEMGGAIMDAHRDAVASGVTPTDPVAAQADLGRRIEEAKNWGKQPKLHQTVLQHLGTGKIIHEEELSELDERARGVTGAKRITIDGNGRGLMKTKFEYGERALGGDAPVTGVASVPHNSHVQNEQDAYHLFTGLFGSDMCPPTTTREHEGQIQSAQQWKEGYEQAEVHLALKNPDHREGGRVKTLLRLAGPHREKIRDKLEKVILTDIIMNSNDRHWGNLILKEDDNGNIEDIMPIDHGLSFGNDMMGYKNMLQADMHNGHYKLVLPEEINDKFSKTSLGDLKRAMPGKKDWQVNQAFLRMRYAQQLQKTHGEIPYSAFKPDLWRINDDTPAIPASKSEDMTEFEHRKNTKQLTHHQFEKFAVDYVDSVSADKNHPDHEAVKAMKDTGFLMGPGGAKDSEKHIRDKNHKRHENKVRSEIGEGKYDFKRREIPKDKNLDNLLAELKFRKEGKEGVNPFANTVNKEDLEEGTTISGGEDKTRKGLYLENFDLPFSSCKA